MEAQHFRKLRCYSLVFISFPVVIAKKAVVYLSPPWTTIFKGEKVTLTCHGFNSSKPERTWWYKNQQLQEVSSTNSIETNQIGKYNCRTQDSALSDPVNLIVSSDLLILQTPYSVFEGETLVLRCRRQNDETIKDVAYYKDNKKLYFRQNSDHSISIPQVSIHYSGNYHCTTILWLLLWPSETASRVVELQVQELFSLPKLKTITSQPTEGTPVTLSCETELSPQRSNTELYFSFFRDDRTIALGWKKSQVLQIPVIWREDSGLYWCEVIAKNQNIRKKSNHVKISVKRIPISGILMETQPSGGQVTEGEQLVLICSIAQGTGNVTFSWHREGIKASLGKKTRRSLEEKFVLSTVNESDAGKYYCSAKDGISSISSLRVNIIVKIPVSQPLFNFSALGAQATLGDVVEFHCHVLRGSFPIQYEFYHEKAILENKMVPSGGSASFNLTVTTGHSGKYFCRANNSFSCQLSETLTLSISVPIRSWKNTATVGITVALISIFILLIATLVIYFKLLRKPGRSPAPNPHSASPVLNLQEPVYSNSSAQMELEPIYSNVNPEIEDMVCSELWNAQQGKSNKVNPAVGDMVYSEVSSKEHGKEANSSKNSSEDKDFSALYAEVKKKDRSRDSEEKIEASGRSQDDTKSHENVKFF
ncbi:Fc receptor-like protein 2 isoform X2 [Notamacropus eugenii]|uniref:Fc receptor-like protein 2 isoform X2 n=1 Tax=Notamacropus eugenii TaxID=9315 RepID=UPI003B66E2CA